MGRNKSAWLNHKVDTICLGNCRVINRLGSKARNFPLVITVFVFEIHPKLKSPFAVAKPALIDSKRDRNTKYSKNKFIFNYLFATLQGHPTTVFWEMI